MDVHAFQAQLFSWKRDGLSSTSRGTWIVSLFDFLFALLQFVPLVGPSLTQEVAPSAALEFDPWPAFGDRFAQRMEKELPSLWSPGRIETQDQWDVETFLLWEAIALEYWERI